MRIESGLIIEGNKNFSLIERLMYMYNTMILIISAISSTACEVGPAFDNFEFYRAPVQKSPSMEQRIKVFSHQRVRWTTLAIRESSPSRVTSPRVGKSPGRIKRQGKRMAEKIESPREGMKIFGGQIRDRRYYERMLQQSLEYWDIEKWSNAEATDYRQLIGPPG